MAYYSADYGYLVFQDHIRVPLDHKEGVKEKYICYCHQITYDDLEDRVIHRGLRQAKDLFMPHQKVLVSKCRQENPFDCSCLADIQKKIEEHLRSN